MDELIKLLFLPSNKIKRGSTIKDKDGKYHVVRLVLDDNVFVGEYDWYDVSRIIKYCESIPLSEVTLAKTK